MNRLVKKELLELFLSWPHLRLLVWGIEGFLLEQKWSPWRKVEAGFEEWECQLLGRVILQGCPLTMILTKKMKMKARLGSGSGSNLDSGLVLILWMAEEAPLLEPWEQQHQQEPNCLLSSQYQPEILKKKTIQSIQL